MYHVGRNLFLNIQQMLLLIIQKEMGASYWEIDKDLVPKCIAFVRNVMLFLASYHVF